MRLYNTLTRQKQDFEPLGQTVGIYSCGPTVYNFAHIGNLRTYIFLDTLRRVLEYNNYPTNSVMNITDVGHLLSDADEGEDKMQKAAKEQHKTPLEIAEFYTSVFFDDLDKLNIQTPHQTPKATEHISEMIDIVSTLLEKGYAYHTSDGIYFDIQKFPEYGKLSRQNIDEQIAGARVEVNSEKRHPSDFALWKHAPKEHLMQWESPWGMGFPGWHIECTAMSQKYLGNHFDIHSGGVDHIPIHHENEIAQAKALSGVDPANFWLHGEFMLVDGGKMSKSLKNTYTISQLEQMGYSALDFRFFCLNAHYRKKLNFTFEGLNAAKVAYDRLCSLVLAHKNGTATANTEKMAEYKSDFENAINDDLNIPLALASLFSLAKEEKSKTYYELILQMDRVFGLRLDKIVQKEEIIPNEVIQLANSRLTAKKQRDYALADTIRNKIAELGYDVLDTKEGFTIKRKT